VPLAFSKKNSVKTNYIEYLNLTIHQEVPRPVRKTLSFSKSMEGHMEFHTSLNNASIAG